MRAVSCKVGDELWQTVETAANVQRGSFLDPPEHPAGVLAVANMEPLWQAVLTKCNELLPKNMGTSRSTGMYHADGRACSAIATCFNHDGTATVWHVEAYDTSARGRLDITVTVHGPWTDNSDAEWERRLKEDMSRVLIVDHCWYTIGKGGTGGFGGHRFRFRRLDGGPEVVSNDMWFGGVIPPAWRERIPDTAEMLEGFHPGPIA
jgi:hypothetical protein